MQTTRRQFILGTVSFAALNSSGMPAMPAIRAVTEHEIRNGSAEFSRIIYKMMYELPKPEVIPAGPLTFKIFNEVIKPNAHAEGSEFYAPRN